MANVETRYISYEIMESDKRIKRLVLDIKSQMQKIHYPLLVNDNVIYHGRSVDISSRNIPNLKLNLNKLSEIELTLQLLLKELKDYSWELEQENMIREKK